TLISSDFTFPRDIQGPRFEFHRNLAGWKFLQSFGSVPDPERPERVSALRKPTLTTWIDLEDGITYIDVPAYPPPTPHIQDTAISEWSSGQTNAQRVALWHALSDTQMENWELRLQIAKERCARLVLS
ncbi:hypothetical protein Tco_0712953, partial [Tanacetum coccineum]